MVKCKLKLDITEHYILEGYAWCALIIEYKDKFIFGLDKSKIITLKYNSAC